MRDIFRNLTQQPAVRKMAAVVTVIVLLLVGWLATERTASSGSSQKPTSAVEETTDDFEIEVPNWAPTEPDVTWHEIANVNLPVSKLAGPHWLTETRATGFTQDDAGAALAAAHILVRTFAGVGSDSFVPTIREQVTGAAKSQLAANTKLAYDGSIRSMDGVRAGDPLPLGQGWIVAYRLVGGTETPTNQTRTVQVLVEGSGESMGFTEYTVDLHWIDDDWAVEAPTWGDWGTAARAVRHPYPTSYRTYDDITAALEMTS